MNPASPAPPCPACESRKSIKLTKVKSEQLQDGSIVKFEYTECADCGFEYIVPDQIRRNEARIKARHRKRYMEQNF